MIHRVKNMTKADADIVGTTVVSPYS